MPIKVFRSYFIYYLKILIKNYTATIKKGFFVHSHLFVKHNHSSLTYPVSGVWLFSKQQRAKQQERKQDVVLYFSLVVFIVLCFSPTKIKAWNRLLSFRPLVKKQVNVNLLFQNWYLLEHAEPIHIARLSLSSHLISIPGTLHCLVRSSTNTTNTTYTNTKTGAITYHIYNKRYLALTCNNCYVGKDSLKPVRVVGFLVLQLLKGCCVQSVCIVMQ